MKKLMLATLCAALGAGAVASTVQAKCGSCVTRSCRRKCKGCFKAPERRKVTAQRGFDSCGCCSGKGKCKTGCGK